MLNKIFGKFSWNTPPWVNQLQSYAKQHPLQFWGRVLAGLLVIILIAVTYHWYSALPKPERVTAKITTPKLTPVEETLIPDVLTIDFGIAYGDQMSARSVAPLKWVGKDVAEGISISPAVAGNWRWDSD